ncbi:MAG: hypothetical protein CMI36_00420 [Owenweeksia sp.]|nr:hypothetical protein [Owenweeksia sp.]MBF97429.1 hypothetical protein [Owenweeksia sp.]HBF18611.1 hypothetical protein [Cryomorphaceae bacterium]|tara:strand:+ start:357 stop:740 length:384 start_codon:yes stop_codon:yes gene_type:complete
MRKIRLFLLIALVFSVGGNLSFGQTGKGFNSEVCDSLARVVNDTSMIGRTVSEVLESLPYQIEKQLFISESRPYYLAGTIIKFKGLNSCWLKIYTTELKYVEKLNLEGNWKFEDFKKEKVTRLEISN